MPATAYLRIPAGAKLVDGLLRRILTAVSAKAPEALGPVIESDIVAPGEVRHCQAISKCRKHALQTVQPHSPGRSARLLHREKTQSLDNAARGEG
jgi:hypothetical protein